MPPKLKLNKSKGKSEIKLSKGSFPRDTNNDLAVPQNNSINPEVQEQFEIELCWCIQQLQRALNSGKLNQRQVQDHTKTLNTLMSNTTPFIKKRQVMRITFGDYRSEMNEESKKLTKGINLKISVSSPSKKSTFLKKAVPLSCSEENVENNLSSNISKVKISNDTPLSPFHFVRSTNDFKFNFSIEES